MRKVIWGGAVVGGILFAASPVAAQNPCTAPPPSGVLVNPTRVFVSMPEFTVQEVDGSQRVSRVQFAMFAPGADPNTTPPVQGPSTVPRSAFTPVTGAPNCYQADFPATIPSATVLVASVKPERLATPPITAAESPWASLTGADSFGSAPAALVASGPVRVSR
jgi:hypothetical protein